MKVYTLWMQRKESYPEEYGPEVLVAWDEGCREANPEGFDEAIEKAKKEYASEAMGFALVTLDVPYKQIRDLCLQAHEPIKAKIVEGSNAS